MEIKIEQPGSNDSETNLEGGVEKESGLSPEGKLEKENMPYADVLFDEVNKKAIKEGVEPEQIIEEIVDNAEIKYKKEKSIKATTELFLSMLTYAKISKSIGEYGKASLGYITAGFPELADQMKEDIKKLNEKERESAEFLITVYESLIKSQESLAKSNENIRKKIEYTIGLGDITSEGIVKSIADLTIAEVNNLNIERIDIHETFKNVREELILLRETLERFGGGLSKAGEEHKEKTRKEMPKMVGKEYKEKK